MNQVHAKLNTRSSWSEAKPFYVLAALTLGALMLYIAFIGKTIFTLVAEKQLETNNRGLATEISELELRTLAQNDSVSIEKAYSMGFVSAKTAEYVAPGLTFLER